MLTVQEEIDALTDAGLLGDRQAEVFVLRDVEATPRGAVAEELGIDPSTVDGVLRQARGKIGDARATVEAVETVRYQHDR